MGDGLEDEDDTCRHEQESYLSDPTQMAISMATRALAAFAIFVSVVAIYNMHQNYLEAGVKKSAIEAGLVQGTVPGDSGVYWIRPDGERLERTP